MNIAGINQSHLEFRGKQLGGKVSFWYNNMLIFIFHCLFNFESKLTQTLYLPPYIGVTSALPHTSLPCKGCISVCLTPLDE